uniref:Capsid n=1 Tax=viral metagenome TaxID=1070528 RepID=A0A2V0R922_9ZZZZ
MTLARHGVPKGSCDSPWYNRPFRCYLNTSENTMANKRAIPASKTTATKPVSKRPNSKVSSKAPTSKQGDTKAPASKQGNKISRGAKSNTRHKPDTRLRETGVPEQMASSTQLSTRTVDPFAEPMSTDFPQVVDLVTYSAHFQPAGDILGSDSIANKYFQSAKGQQWLTDVAQAYRRAPAVPFTVDQLVVYINTVAGAYSFMIATREHMRYCYWSKGKQNLTDRLGLIFSSDIRDAHLKLADELSSHFLPPKVIPLLDKLHGIYTTGISTDAPDFQIVPWTEGFNTDSDFVNTFDAHLAALRAIPNLTALRGAFASNLYDNVAVPMEQLNMTNDFKNPDNYLSPEMGEVTYDPEMLTIWSNLPLYTYTAGAVQAYKVATTLVSVSIPYVGKGVTSLTTATKAVYVTANSRFEPGLLVPMLVPTVNGENNFKYINNSGVETEVDASAGQVDSLILGIAARNVENVYAEASLGRTIPSGFSHSYSNVRNIGYDSYEFMTDILS